MPCGATQQLFVRQTERSLSCNLIRKHLENVPHKWLQPDLLYTPSLPQMCKNTRKMHWNKPHQSWKPLFRMKDVDCQRIIFCFKSNWSVLFFLPRRAWKRWLPKIADTFPTLVFKACSSGLVRLAWYCLSSPTALSVSASQDKWTFRTTSWKKRNLYAPVKFHKWGFTHKYSF